MTQIKKGEVDLSFKKVGLDNGISTLRYIRDGHVGVEQAVIFFIDFFFEAQEFFKAVKR